MSKLSLKNENTGGITKISDEIIIGRSEKSATLYIEDENLSRAHFKIIYRNEKGYIVDLESSNGTYVNEKQMPQNHAYELKNRDIIEAGEQKFSVVLKGQTKEDHEADRDLSSEIYKQAPRPIEKAAKKSVFAVEENKGPTKSPKKESEVSKYYLDEKELEYDEDELDSEYASFWARLFASFIDGAIISIISKIAFIAIIIALPQWKSHQVFQLIFNLFVGAIAGYFVILKPLSNTGQSPGKKLVGIKLVTDDYLQPGMNKLVWREYIFKYITAVLSVIALIAYFFDKKNKFIHDHLSGTRVIIKKE